MQIIYATYQFFPDSRTNTFQSISTIKNFIEKKYEVELVYPDRKETQNDIKEFYEIKNEFKITKIKHSKKFEYKAQNFLNKVVYLCNHLLFASRIKKYLKASENRNFILYTRSPFVLFTSRNIQKKIIYEIHQITKIAKFFVWLSNKKNKKIVFVALTPFIKNDLCNLGVNEDNILHLETGYDENLFSEIEKYKIVRNNEIIRFIFGGSLEISGLSKGLEKIILAFNELVQDGKLTKIVFSIYCSNLEDKNKLDSFLKDQQIKDFVHIHNRITSKEFYHQLFSSHVGLIPLPDSEHVNKFSSSMKFFEYIRAGLVILGSNVEPNKRFNYKKMLLFENNLDSIKKAILESVNILDINKDFSLENIREYSYQNRVQKTIDKINSI
tara:strand:- start:4231 stop:5379 length:1149 start_codon:yes stop_codon:yes gene_type:complete